MVLACTTWSARAEVLNVHFLPHPVVRTPAVHLAELIAVDGADTAAVRRLLGIPVSLQLGPGATVDIGKEEVLAHITRSAPELLALVQWNGPQHIPVARPAQAVDIAQLQAEARSELQKWLDQRFQVARVALLSAGKNAPSMTAGETTSLRPVEGPAASRMAVWADLTDGGGSIRSFPIWFAVEAVRTAFVARRSVESLGLISADDLRPTQMDVAAYRDDAVTDADQALGYRTIVPLTAGSVLLRSQLRQAADVEAGDEVLLRISQRELRIETHAIALEQGRAGQVVHLRSPVSGAILSARVAGPDLVEVEP